jgi:bifunctional lysine-specific demethylase and histidyl-hydroxylase MINA
VHSGNESSLSLAALLGPTGLEEFFRKYWERKPLRVARGNPDFYAGLPTRSDFKFLLSSLTNPSDGWVNLVKERARPPNDSMFTQEGSLNLPEIFTAHESGYTLLLSQVQKRHRGTALLCRNLEAALSQSNVPLRRHIGANAYLSPPDAQGFSIHYDPHDVLVLQLDGHKNWRIYKRLVAFPIVPPSEATLRQDPGPVKLELLLAPGDLLYIPRGFLHEARTKSESSLHLTLALETVTWRDLLAEVMAMEPRLRETLPRNYVDPDSPMPRRRAALARVVKTLARSACSKKALAGITGQLLENLEVPPNGGFPCIEEPAALRGDSWLSLQEGVFGRVEIVPKAALLHLPGASFEADRTMAEAFRFLLQTPSFRVRDLPVKARLSEKLKFLQRLVTGGYLVPRSSSEVKKTRMRP